MNDDLVQLTFGTAETTTLDFKGPTKFDRANRAEVAELHKAIAALANRDGGDLEIGVAQRPSGFDRIGLTDEEA